MALFAANNLAINMAALPSYAGSVQSSAPYQGTSTRSILFADGGSVSFTLRSQNGQTFIEAISESRVLPGAISLAGYLLTDQTLSVQSIAWDPAIIDRLAQGANTTEVFAGLLTGADEIYGTAFADNLLGYGGNDRLRGDGGNDILNGGEGSDIAIFRGVRDDYTITQGANGSTIVVDRVSGRDGTDTLNAIETLQFADQSLALTTTPATGLGVADLFAQNQAQAKAISATYQVLLGGVPSQSGYEFLIQGNLGSNFGAGAGRQFNDENIYINVANALINGNVSAKAAFLTLAQGASLSDQVASLYSKLIPAGRQSAEGLTFLTRPEGLAFYEKVAAERGLTGAEAPAVIAFASLLKIAVDGGIGIGNPIADLMASVANGSSTLPASGSALSFIETVDGTAFDADDAADAAAVSPLAQSPVPLMGVIDLAAPDFA